jgi:hypothetical protein
VRHVIVKLLSGRSERQKAEAWEEKVYKPDIGYRWDKLYKKPGYKTIGITAFEQHH